MGSMHVVGERVDRAKEEVPGLTSENKKASKDNYVKDIGLNGRWYVGETKDRRPILSNMYYLDWICLFFVFSCQEVGRVKFGGCPLHQRSKKNALIGT